MRRADRLFQIIQVLRGSRGPVTAATLAAELEVSKRTVYRDVADLVGQRVPIDGAAGLGYVLDPAYDMPPLMLTPDEVEAIVLGAQWVANRPDPVLARSARDVIAKIASVVPEGLRAFIAEPAVGARPADAALGSTLDLQPLRAAIHQGLELRLRYRSGTGDETERSVRPVILGYAETHCVLIAWCELRQAFRHFRTDRIVAAEVVSGGSRERRADLRRRWERWREIELRRAVQLRGSD